MELVYVIFISLKSFKIRNTFVCVTTLFRKVRIINKTKLVQHWMSWTRSTTQTMRVVDLGIPDSKSINATFNSRQVEIQFLCSHFPLLMQVIICLKCCWLSENFCSSTLSITNLFLTCVCFLESNSSVAYKTIVHKAVFLSTFFGILPALLEKDSQSLLSTINLILISSPEWFKNIQSWSKWSQVQIWKWNKKLMCGIDLMILTNNTGKLKECMKDVMKCINRDLPILSAGLISKATVVLFSNISFFDLGLLLQFFSFFKLNLSFVSLRSSWKPASSNKFHSLFSVFRNELLSRCRWFKKKKKHKKIFGLKFQYFQDEEQIELTMTWILGPIFKIILCTSIVVVSQIFKYLQLSWTSTTLGWKTSVCYR